MNSIPCFLSLSSRKFLCRETGGKDRQGSVGRRRDSEKGPALKVPRPWPFVLLEEGKSVGSEEGKGLGSGRKFTNYGLWTHEVRSKYLYIVTCYLVTRQ
jgi:hypothetical protein